jgi:hypothetical protein
LLKPIFLSQILAVKLMTVGAVVFSFNSWNQKVASLQLSFPWGGKNTNRHTGGHNEFPFVQWPKDWPHNLKNFSGRQYNRKSLVKFNEPGSQKKFNGGGG